MEEDEDEEESVSIDAEEALAPAADVEDEGEAAAVLAEIDECAAALPSPALSSSVASSAAVRKIPEAKTERNQVERRKQK